MTMKTVENKIRNFVRLLNRGGDQKKSLLKMFAKFV